MDIQVQILEELIAVTEAAGIPIWFCGGYALDALEGRVTRQHTDIDFFVRREYQECLRAVLSSAGFTIQAEGPPSAPHFTVFRKMEEWLDCITYERLSDGTLVTDRGEAGVFPWPDNSFPDEPNATLIGKSVRVISYEAQYVFMGSHQTFDPETPLRDKDVKALEILSARIPPEVREQLASLFEPLPGVTKGN